MKSSVPFWERLLLEPYAVLALTLLALLLLVAVNYRKYVWMIVKSLHETRPQLPVILMTGFHTTEAAIEAMKLGAYDYILKPPDQEEFVALIISAGFTAERTWVDAERLFSVHFLRVA